MGRSYAYECPKCGFQAKVSGGPDQGVLVWVQTIACKDCKKLYDAVARLKAPEGSYANTAAAPNAGPVKSRISVVPPPAFPLVMNRVRPAGLKRFQWVSFKLQCPASPIHRVRSWNEPDRCPKCATYLEKSALPYRLWE